MYKIYLHTCYFDEYSEKQLGNRLYNDYRCGKS